MMYTRTPIDVGSIRERILYATLAVIGRVGIDGVTHRLVAHEASVSLGSTTRHFADRQTMIREAFSRYMDDAERDALRLRDTDTTADIVSFAKAVVAWSGTWHDKRDIEAAEYEMLVHGHRDPELAVRIRAWHAVLDGLVAEQLERCGLARPLAAARALRAAVRGAELERLTDQSITDEELVERLVTFLEGHAQARP